MLADHGPALALSIDRTKKPLRDRHAIFCLLCSEALCVATFAVKEIDFAVLHDTEISRHVTLFEDAFARLHEPAMKPQHELVEEALRHSFEQFAPVHRRAVSGRDASVDKGKENNDGKNNVTAKHKSSRVVTARSCR
jgi:hypothetical protein